jgi:tetratricopeptide (TPR) repeat protein
MLTYRDRDADAREVARELGVRYVLAGQVVTSGSSLRVSCELVDARSGHQVDAQRFERPLAELFALQDDITQHIVAALAPALKSAEAARARRSETGSLDAWALVNRAHIRLSQDLGDADAIRSAVADCRRALELDDDYGLAWAVLGLALSLAHGQKIEGLPNDNMEEALAAVRRAVALDPDDATVHHCHGATMGNLARTDEGVRAYERALAIDPNAAASLGGLGAALVFARRAEEGKDALDRAIRLSPHDPLLYHWLGYRGLCELVVGRFEQARDDARASVERTPSRTGLAVLAVALAHLGEIPEARAVYDRLRALDARVHPESWATFLSTTWRSDVERARLVEGMWLASGLARGEGSPGGAD